jgi:hypothetical protein
MLQHLAYMVTYDDTQATDDEDERYNECLLGFGLRRILARVIVVVCKVDHDSLRIQIGSAIIGGLRSGESYVSELF